MRRSIALGALIALATAIGSPGHAQSATEVAPVPGPYQAAPAPRANPYANQERGQVLPYWMRPQPGPAIPGNAPARNFIPGWVWSPYPPNGTSPPAPRPAPQSGGYWPASPQTGPATFPWAQPGYGASPWSNPGFTPWPSNPYGAPRYYGATPQPNQ